MADLALDTAAARADGVSDADIAAFLAPKVGFDLVAARKDGVPDSAIVDFLSPTKAEAPTPAAEPPSNMGLGVTRAAKQGLATIPGETLASVGSMYEAGGTALKGMARAEQDQVRKQLEIFDLVDRGETIKPKPVAGMGVRPDPDVVLANSYGGKSPEERAAMRKEVEVQIAALPPVEDTLKSQIATQFLDPIGEKLRKVGHEEAERMRKVYPLTPEEEQRFSVQVTKVVTSLAPFLLVGGVGEVGKVGALPSIMGYSGVEAFGKTYDEALKAGASKEDATIAASISGFVQGGLNAVPLHQSMQVADQIPKLFKGEFVKTLTEVAKASASLVAFTQVAKIADNATAKATFDPNRDMMQGVGDLREMAVTAVGGAALPVAGAMGRGVLRTAGRMAERVLPRRPEEVIKPVLDAPDVDSAITAAREVVQGTPVDVETIAAQAREFGGRADQEQAGLLQLFGGLNRGTVEQAADGSYHYRTGEGEQATTIPLKLWDGRRAPAAEGQEPAPIISPALVAAQRDYYEKLGVKVVYFENDRAIPFDGAVDPTQPNTIFLSNDPTRNVAQVGAHELTHVLESTKLPDGTNLGDVLAGQISEGMTNAGWRHAVERFGQTAPDRAAFPAGHEGDSAHADAVVSHLVRELGADIGGEAPRFQTFIPRVLEAVEQRFGLTAAKDVLAKLLEGIRQTMATLRAFFSKPAEGAEYGQPETVSQHWVTNLEQIHDTLAKMYAERFAGQVDRERAALEAMRPKPAEPIAAIPETKAAPPETAAVPEAPAAPAAPAVPQRLAPAPAPAADSPQATLLRQTEAAILAKVGGVEARLTKTQAERLATVRTSLDELLRGPDVAKPPEPAIEVAPAPEAPVSEYGAKVTAERARVWADKSVMGKTQQGIPRNENFATGVARERVMREEAAAEIAEALDTGIPPDAIPAIARMYRRADGQTPQAAFDAAVDRWVTKEEATAAAHFGDQDVATFDHLKAVGEGDPIMAEVFAQLEEHYAGGKKELPGDEDIPFGAEPTEAPARPGGEVAPREAGRPQSGEAGGEPGSRSEVPRAPGALDDGPAFSPKQTEPPGPTLLDTREATPAELAARQRARDKEEAEARMRGRKGGKGGQEAADDLPLFGGDRQGALFSPKVVDLTERIERRQREKAGTTGRDEPNPPTVSKEELQQLSDRELDALHAHIETGALGSPRETKELYGQIQDELDARGRGAMQDRVANDVSFSPKIAGENKDRTYTPEQQKAFENVGRAAEFPRLGDWLATARQDLGKKIARALVDPFIGLKESNPAGYMAARLANSSGGALATFFEHGTLKFEGAAYNFKDRNGGVVNHLMKPLGPEAHDFIWWVAANRAEGLSKEGRENLFTPEDIVALKKTNQGLVDFDYKLSNGQTTRSREAIYLDSLNKYDVFNKNALDLELASGLIKREVYDKLRKNKFYVPFLREASESDKGFAGPTVSSGFTKQKAFERLTGGTEKLNRDLWQNAFSNWEHGIDASIRNKAGRENLEFAAQPGVGAAREVSEQQYRGMSDKEKAETSWVMRDGEKVYFHVTDPFLLQAVSALNAGDKSGAIMRVGQGFAKLLRVGVTSSPIFAVRNIIRDTEQSLAVSPLGINVAKNLYTGFKMNDVGGAVADLGRAMAGQEQQAPRMSDEALSAMAGGGLMRIGAASDTGVSTPKVSRILNTPDSVNALWGYVDKTARAYRGLLNQGEDVNRLALYKKLVDEGMDHDAASFASRDLMDFTLHGAAPLVRAITSLVPFQNAWMQGLYKVGRAAADADKSVFAAVGGKVAWQTTKRVATVWGAMALMTMALDAYYADDPDYKNRTEFDRNSNWWFKIGDAEIRIPMGFEIAAASRIAANGAEVFFDKEMTGERFAKNVWSILGTNMSLNPIPQAVKPILDIAENQSRTGAPITPRGLERLRAEDQYTANNTMAARGVSSVINAGLRAGFGTKEGPSPIQIDYLVQAYGGWLATSLLGLADTAVRSFTSEPARPAGDIVSSVTQNMVSTTPTSQRTGRYVNMLYDQAQGIERAYASYMDKIRQGRTEEAREFFADNKDLIQKHGLVQSVTRLEGDLNRQVRLIVNSPDPAMTPERKRLAIMQITAMKNRAAEQAMAPR